MRACDAWVQQRRVFGSEHETAATHMPQGRSTQQQYCTHTARRGSRTSVRGRAGSKTLPEHDSVARKPISGLVGRSKGHFLEILAFCWKLHWLVWNHADRCTRGCSSKPHAVLQGADPGIRKEPERAASTLISVLVGVFFTFDFAGRGSRIFCGVRKDGELSSITYPLQSEKNQRCQHIIGQKPPPPKKNIKLQHWMWVILSSPQ